METTSLPTGTVTFLFTDIEGSTQLWEQHPDAMRLAHAAVQLLAAGRHQVLVDHLLDSVSGGDRGADQSVETPRWTGPVPRP